MLFPSVIRTPDFVSGATDKTEFRFEENINSDCPVLYDISIDKNVAKVYVHPSGSPVKFLKLRFSADLSFVESVCGDGWLTCGSDNAITWTSVTSFRNLPWFCYLRAKDNMACYGVKTGANCFAFWQIDTRGITLFLNLMSSDGGANLKETILACEIVEYIAPEGQGYFNTATIFAGMMCEKPVLPNEPVFGLNNWYWAYGDITHNSVMTETDMLIDITKGLKHKPYMIIDDGWQADRVAGENYYIGGPWNSSEKFGNIQYTAECIRNKGAKPGIWFRALLTNEDVPSDAILRAHDNGIVLDPTHPFAIEKIISDTTKIRNYGFDLIKHDFSTYDIMGGVLFNNSPATNLALKPFTPYDNTKPLATILKNFYKTIQNASNNAQIIGCGVIAHLAAGIHSICRVGTDTSGRLYEWTVRNGVNSFMRLPLNKKFFITDHDCACFTEKVPFEENLKFLELCARADTVTLASIKPNLLTSQQLQRVADVFKIADNNNNSIEIENFEKTSLPEKFIHNGKSVEYNWFKYYNGARSQISWKD